MKIAALSALIAAAHAAQVNRVDVQPTYEAWCAQFGKCSDFSQEESVTRTAVYADNVAFMDAHNSKYAAGQVTFDMGVNEFSAMTQ